MPKASKAMSMKSGAVIAVVLMRVRNRVWESAEVARKTLFLVWQESMRGRNNKREKTKALFKGSVSWKRQLWRRQTSPLPIREKAMGV